MRGLIVAALALLIAACATEAPPIDAATRAVIAPTGALRVGLYQGTPTSIIPATGGAEAKGVGYDLGREFARYLGVVFEPVVFSRNDEVMAAARAGRVDVVFTNATAERAQFIDFVEPHLDIELGYLLRRDSPIASLGDVDRAGMRIGVTERSTSDGVLTRSFKAAQVVRAATLKDGIALLNEAKIDAYATNKATLFEMGDQVPGSRALAGRWGAERHALGLPKGREAGLPVARQFFAKAVADGTVKTAIDRSGLRGAVVATAGP